MDIRTIFNINGYIIKAIFERYKYYPTLLFDESLGSASYTRGENVNELTLTATPTQYGQFVGWYIDGTLVSANQSINYTITDDIVIEARFSRVWQITTNVVGSGSIGYNRQSSDLNIVEFYVIPDEYFAFERYVIGGMSYSETPLILTLTDNIEITAYFIDGRIHIEATTNIEGASVYVSDNDQYEELEATLWARPYPNYVFEKWSDGNRENPRTITTDKSLSLVAEYTHIQETNGIYQYRCWVKDQLDMEAPPKAFMVVDTFTLKEDYLTNANSTINVLEMAGNINNGDVIVVYNPKGETIYQGVITSISDLKITCSQMQSFYKGLWIYNVNPQTYLEDEIALLMQDYADGKLYGSTYVDTLVAQRLGGITIQSDGMTEVNLPTDLDKDGNEQYTQKDFEKWIYELYESYNIIFDFEINFSGTNYVTIKVPTYSSISIGNNHYAIQNLSPMQTIEETNRLVIYDKDKNYRTTYVATTNGIVEQPSSLANRFNITNTKVVFSDDSADDLIASNLPANMFNHKVTFDLFLKNSLYQFKEFKLGMPIEIYYNGNEYYNSIITGRSFTKKSNQNVTSVSFVCGLVRTAITQKLTLGVI